MQTNIHFFETHSSSNVADRINVCGNLLRQVPLVLAMTITLISAGAAAETAAINPGENRNASISSEYFGNESAQATQGDGRTHASRAKASRNLQKATNDLHNAMADFQQFLTPDQHTGGSLVALSE